MVGHHTESRLSLWEAPLDLIRSQVGVAHVHLGPAFGRVPNPQPVSSLDTAQTNVLLQGQHSLEGGM